MPGDLLHQSYSGAVVLTLERELPCYVAVQVEAWRDRGLDGCVDIEAIIAVERDSQKGIVIRKGADAEENRRTLQKSLEKMLGVKVNLKLFVRVERGWTRSPKRLKSLGTKNDALVAISAVQMWVSQLCLTA